MRFKRDSWEYVGGFGSLTRDMLAAMLDQSSDCVKILDPEGRIDFMNRSCRRTLEIHESDAATGNRWEELWPEESRGTVRAAIASAKAGLATRFEAFCPTTTGTPKWWDVSVTPVRDETGELFAILALSRDVTAHHQARESLETMAQEMRHRLRNAYAVSGSIALASGREDSAHEPFAAELAQRLHSLSLVQSSLIDPAEGARLPEVVERIVDAFDANHLVAVSDLPDVLLGEQAVRLLALVLSELATNSLKHGALGEGCSVELAASSEQGELRVVWRESVARGSGPQVGPGEGSGHRLMQRMARAHGGRFEVDFSPDRIEARLQMPVER
jgi:PAS domain S-box-containing protein